ncbi:LysR substrate-binding domain-containing protein [Brevibacterium zhoupengii]|uniref:LysR substrate-binding domain-containing protein n=1 Tax=Brevibacterium zhoupengii TaxID=2898795 RepID=UPI001E31DA91|nr:LysR substrate-binding domain-containing protein [Brevibacterium zhoupengii]
MQDLSRMQDWPELPALGLLVTLSASAQSIGQAAEAMGLAQPNASRSLRNLERDLKVPLLQRSPQGTQLTAEGHAVAQWASKVIDAYADLNAGTRAIQDARAGTVRVSASLTVAEYLLPRYLTTFTSMHPDIDVGLAVENSSAVIAAVREQRCDLGLIESVSLPEGFPAEVVGHDRLMIASAPTFAEAWTHPIGAEELATVPLLVREVGSGTREVLDAALAQYGGARVAGEYGSNSALKIAAATGIAPVVLSELALRDDFSARRLVPLPVESGVALDRELHAVWSPRRRLSTGARALLEHMVNVHD